MPTYDVSVAGLHLCQVTAENGSDALDKAHANPEFGFEQFIAIHGWLDDNECGEGVVDMWAQNVDDPSDTDSCLMFVTTDAGDERERRRSRVQ